MVCVMVKVWFNVLALTVVPAKANTATEAADKISFLIKFRLINVCYSSLQYTMVPKTEGQNIYLKINTLTTLPIVLKCRDCLQSVGEVFRSYKKSGFFVSPL